MQLCLLCFVCSFIDGIFYELDIVGVFVDVGGGFEDAFALFGVCDVNLEGDAGVVTYGWAGGGGGGDFLKVFY